jgi:hypothetical protein
MSNTPQVGMIEGNAADVILMVDQGKRRTYRPLSFTYILLDINGYEQYS